MSPNSLNSKSVFIMHKITQSGVFVEAIRHNTPVIMRQQISLNNDMSKCGVTINNLEVAALFEAINKVNKNLNSLQLNCMKLFNKEFSSNNFLKYYEFLIKKS